MQRAKVSSVLVSVLALALWPLATGAFGVDFVTKTMIYAIVALSLELLVGTTGLVCFGQAAFFGLAGYAAVKLSPEGGPASVLWLLPASMAVAAAYALFMGALSLRTRGVYFIMVTLAFAQMAYYLVHDTPLGGGSDGIYLYVKPVLAVGSVTLLDLDRPLTMYYVVLTCLAGVFAALALMARSRFGRALAGIKADEQRMRATGYSTYPYKLAAFVASGAIAGMGGFLFAVKDGFVNPELLSWHFSRRRADHDHPRRPRPPARRGARCICVRAAAGILQVRGDLRCLCQALAARAGLDHHRQRRVAAARADRYG